MPRRIRLLFVLAALSFADACASAANDPSAAPAEPAPQVHPPELVRGTRPDLRIPASASSRATVRIELEVMVDDAGRPDMRTFKATGLGADINYSALRAWIETSSFRPARLDGRPIAGLFKMRMEVSVRRM